MRPALLTTRRLAELRHAHGSDPEWLEILAHAEQQRLMLGSYDVANLRNPAPCPVCSHPMQDPDAMDRLELKRIRSVVGARLGYQAKGLEMPLHVFAGFLRVSTSTLTYYLKGERTVDGVKSPVRIPPHVALRARSLQVNQTLRLSVKAEATQDMLAKRKEKWRNRKARRDQREAEAAARAREVPDAPF